MASFKFQECFQCEHQGEEKLCKFCDSGELFEEVPDVLDFDENRMELRGEE